MPQCRLCDDVPATSKKSGTAVRFDSESIHDTVLQVSYEHHCRPTIDLYVARAYVIALGIEIREERRTGSGKTECGSIVA